MVGDDDMSCFLKTVQPTAEDGVRLCGSNGVGRSFHHWGPRGVTTGLCTDGRAKLPVVRELKLEGGKTLPITISWQGYLLLQTDSKGTFYGPI